MTNNELDNLVESFLTPKPTQKAMDLKELFALFEELEKSKELLSEQGFTALSNIGMKQKLRGTEESYKTDFFNFLQSALGSKIGSGNASDSLKNIIEEIGKLKNKENWSNYNLSQTISVITFIESLYEMIYNVQGDNPDVAGKMFERFIAFATNGEVSSQLALMEPQRAKEMGATSTSIFDLVTSNNEYVSVKLLKEFKVTGSINNLYKYLFNETKSYVPIDTNTLSSIKTNKSVTYVVTIKGTDKQELVFYSFIINCDNFISIIGLDKIQAYNNSVQYKEKIDGFNQSIELLKQKQIEIETQLEGTAPEQQSDYYSELKQVMSQINDLLLQKDKLTKGTTSFEIYTRAAAQHKQSLWGTVLKVEIGEKDLIIENSKSIFDGTMKRLIDEASAVYYKVSNLLLKLEDDATTTEDKISIGKEAYTSVSTLEKDLVSVAKPYGINLRQKEKQEQETTQTKLF